MPAWTNEKATESIHTVSSWRAQTGTHKQQENTPIAYLQKENSQSNLQFLFAFQWVKGTNKKAP